MRKRVRAKFFLNCTSNLAYFGFEQNFCNWVGVHLFERASGVTKTLPMYANDGLGLVIKGQKMTNQTISGCAAAQSAPM